MGTSEPSLPPGAAASHQEVLIDCLLHLGGSANTIVFIPKHFCMTIMPLYTLLMDVILKHLEVRGTLWIMLNSIEIYLILFIYQDRKSRIKH